MFRASSIVSVDMHSKLKGITLIEIMITLVLSSSLLLSGFYLLQHSLQLSHTQQQRLDLYNRQRYTKYLLSHSIRMAGYLPCSAFHPPHANFSAISLVHSPFPAWLQSANKNSSILKIAFASPKLSYLISNMHTLSSRLNMQPKINFKRQRQYIISDCHQLEMFTYPHQLQHIFAKHSVLTTLQTQWYYLRADSTSHHSALFMRNETGRSEEVIPNVQQFHVVIMHNKPHSPTSTTVQIKLHYQKNIKQQFTVRLRNL